MYIGTIAISSFGTKLEEHENSNVSSNKALNLPEAAVYMRRGFGIFSSLMKRKPN